MKTPIALLPLAAAALLAACANSSMTPMKPMMMMTVDNAALPEAVRVPAGEMQKLSTTGIGEITYECREKSGMAGQFEWAFVAPVATLNDAAGKPVGKYYAGPTWEANDGSKFTGKQVAVAPATPGNIPLQLVKAEPAMGAGAMQGINYVQRLKTQGGVAPSAPCTVTNKMERRQVAYQADYVFYGR